MTLLKRLREIFFPRLACPTMATAGAEATAPDVIVDFVFESGLLHIAVSNIGTASAYQVNCQFNRTFNGLGGGKELSSLPLFQNIAFLPPGKTIQTFVDHSDAYFQRNEPEQLEVAVSFRDKKGQRFGQIIAHDLSIYREVSYLVSS